jgi:hypothetical protein
VKYRFNFAINEDHAERNALIVGLYNRGNISKTEIGRLFNLSPSRIGKIIWNSNLSLIPLHD